MKIWGFFIAFVMLTGAAQAGAVPLPEGWRVLALEEFRDTYHFANRSEEDGFLTVNADFDGDGQEDSARFLAREDGQEYALFISHTAGGTLSHYKQISGETLEELEGLGIRLAEPGDYATTCSYDYAECAADEPKLVHLTHAGLHFFLFEAASSVIYWDASQRGFKSVSTSD